jgi:hypothetical protein
VGGEWANKLYDESMVNRFNKIGKRYGVQVEKTKILENPVVQADGVFEPPWGAKYIEIHSLKITPEMRQAIGATKFNPFADLPGPSILSGAEEARKKAK